MEDPEAISKKDLATSARACSTFAERLGRHVRFEEQEVFDRAQRELPDAALEAIALATRKSRAATVPKKA